MALAGGVTIEMPHGQGYLYQEGEILSPDGHCRAFDAARQGHGLRQRRRRRRAAAARRCAGRRRHRLRGHQGVGGQQRRRTQGRLSRAERRRPGRSGRRGAAISRACRPTRISYIECHGTGTPVGDPIEVAALTQAFRSLTDRTRLLRDRLGRRRTSGTSTPPRASPASSRSCEMLRHRTMLPTLHFREPNPEVDLAAHAVLRQRRHDAVASATAPRRAGVNSLGVGGTNAHVVLEEAPAGRDRRSRPRDGTVLVLSARSEGVARSRHRPARRSPRAARRRSTWTTSPSRWPRAGAGSRSGARSSRRRREDAIAALRVGQPAALAERAEHCSREPRSRSCSPAAARSIRAWRRICTSRSRCSARASTPASSCCERTRASTCAR